MCCTLLAAYFKPLIAHYRAIGNAYVGNVSQFGAVVAPLYKAHQHIIITLGFHVNGSIGLVLNKTMQAQYIGHLFGAIAKKYALYAAAYGNIKMLRHAVGLLAEFVDFLLHQLLLYQAHAAPYFFTLFVHYK